MKIIADKNIPFLKGAIEHYGDVTFLPGIDFTYDSIKEADTLVVRTVTRLNEKILKNTNIKLICTATIGFDHIDTKYCEENNITWKNAPGCNSGSVEQYIISSLIIIARKRGFLLKNKVIGIIGVGNVGKKVARACEILGMKVLLNDPIREQAEENNDFVSIEEIQKEADIITFHVPLTKEGPYKTFHMADHDFFLSLRKHPIIINSARGSIVETNAIKEALRKERISGAIIDCWENEPEIDLEYMNLVDIATPHIAGYSADGKANATRMSLENIANFYNLDKTPISKVKAPDPANPYIDMNGYVSSKNKIENIILKTYNPLLDYARFMEAPERFSWLRSDYPLRREYHAYTVDHTDRADREILDRLGFK